MTHQAAMKEVRRHIRQGYAWPGGYALVFTWNGEDMCSHCARKHYRAISEYNRYIFRFIRRTVPAVYVWAGCDTDEDTPCADCGAQLSAYYDDKGEEEA